MADTNQRTLLQSLFHFYAYDPGMYVKLNIVMYVFAFLSILLLLFPLLLTLKLDGHIELSFLVVFMPLMVGNVVLGIGFYFDDLQEVGIDDCLLYVMLLMVFELFMALKLDKVLNWQWWIVFLPLILMECLWLYGYVLYSVNEHGKAIEEENVDRQTREMTRIDTIEYYTFNLSPSVSRLLLMLNLVLKLDFIPSLYWTLVLLPINAFGCIEFIRLVYRAKYPHTPEAKEKKLAIATLILFTFGWSIVFLFTNLLISKLNDPKRFSIGVLLIPIFVVSGVLVVGFVFVFPFWLYRLRLKLESYAAARGNSEVGDGNGDTQPLLEE